MNLTGLHYNHFEPGDEPPDFERMLGNESSSSHFDISQMIDKVQRRIRALGMLLAYWTPTRLEAAATRYAIAWHGTPELTEQFEKAFLHYLNLTQMTAYGTSDESLHARFDSILQTFAQLLREARERVEFTFNRASAIRASASTEHIANSLLYRESNVVKAVQEFLTWKANDLSQAVDAVRQLCRRYPEIERASPDERVALGQRVRTWARERAVSLKEPLAQISRFPIDRGAADPFRVIRELFPEDFSERGQPA